MQYYVQHLLAELEMEFRAFGEIADFAVSSETCFELWTMIDLSSCE